MSRKIRQCPHCKSKKGFRILVHLGGYEEKEMSFQGKILKHERNGADNVDDYAQCLECKKNIDSELLDLENV